MHDPSLGLAMVMNGFVLMFGTFAIAILLIRTFVEAFRPDASELKRFVGSLILFVAPCAFAELRELR